MVADFDSDDPRSYQRGGARALERPVRGALGSRVVLGVVKIERTMSALKDRAVYRHPVTGTTPPALQCAIADFGIELEIGVDAWIWEQLQPGLPPARRGAVRTPGTEPLTPMGAHLERPVAPAGRQDAACGKTAARDW